MSKLLLRGAVAAALSIPAAALAATDAEIAELRSMINQMQSQYESRIRNLEERLAKAEADAASPPAKRSQTEARDAEWAAAKAEPKPMKAPVVAAPQVSAPSAGGALGALTSGNAFNPQISGSWTATTTMTKSGRRRIDIYEMLGVGTAHRSLP